MSAEPLVTILIPTYNRAECLDECLACLLKEQAVLEGQDVEVLVSDNCSSDETETICRKYEKLFGDTMTYVRQPMNIGPSDNFTYLLRNGRGKFLKFLTDKEDVVPGSVSRLVEIVKRHEAEKPVLCFGGSFISYLPKGEHPITSFDALAGIVSYWTTRIDSYGVWREDVAEVIPLQDAYASSMIQQVAVVWHLFDMKRRGVFCNFNFVQGSRANRSIAGGYNVAEVFSKNYLGILRPYVEQGKLSRAAYENEKKRLYFGHIYGMYFDFERYFAFKKGGFLKYTREYWFKWYYWASLAAVPVFTLVGRMPLAKRQKFFGWIRSLRRIVASI